MEDKTPAAEKESDEYYVLPEEAIALLPEEWQDQIQARISDGRAVLKSVDRELSQLGRLSNSLIALATLKHVRDRLVSYRFAATMDAVLELDMLTTAFIVTYVRLHEGGTGSGFARDVLPERLRSFHDDIISLRNRRFAHTGDHDSVSEAMEIGLQDDRFEVKLSISLGFHIGGATEWQEIVDVLDTIYAERCFKLLSRLKEKTGHDWVFAGDPAAARSG